MSKKPYLRRKPVVAATAQLVGMADPEAFDAFWRCSCGADLLGEVVQRDRYGDVTFFRCPCGRVTVAAAG